VTTFIEGGISRRVSKPARTYPKGVIRHVERYPAKALAEYWLRLIAEADAFVALWKDFKLPDGRERVVRHGYGPHRAIQTGVGPASRQGARPG
jgi:hypothetical protein